MQAAIMIDSILEFLNSEFDAEVELESELWLLLKQKSGRVRLRATVSYKRHGALSFKALSLNFDWYCLSVYSHRKGRDHLPLSESSRTGVYMPLAILALVHSSTAPLFCCQLLI